MKFCNKFALLYLEIIGKGELFRISGSQFLKWLFGPETFTGLSRNGPLVGFRSLSLCLPSLLVNIDNY